MSNDLALKCFAIAREHYVSHRFELAQQEIKKYKQSVDYGKFDQSDRRTVNAPQISVVVVSHRAGPTLLSCLHSVLAQEGASFEVIVVDNGGNEHVHNELTTLPLLLVKLPTNLLPSEGRNIGAHFARGELIVFLDDDAVMVQGYLKSGFAAMKDDKRMGLRGQALSKTPHKIAPKHYSLGQTPTLAEFNLEGNMLIRKTVLDAVGGFDALMFGHEGKELSQRCKRQFPGMVIQYRPELCIAHDFAEMDLLEAKRERQSLGQDYLKFLQSKHMNPGISILVRAGDDLAAAHDFLESLVKHNSYKPIEVLLWANNTQKALATSGKFITQIFVRVLPASTPSLGRVGQQARYNQLLIVDLPMRMKSDCLLRWINSDRAEEAKALLCSKMHAQMISDLDMNSALTVLAERVGLKKTPAQTSISTLHKPASEKLPNKAKVNANTRVVLETAPYVQGPTEKEFTERYGWLKPPILPKNIPVLENNSNNFSNKEVHRCTLFPPYQPSKQKSDSPFKILAVVGERMHKCLAFDADVVALDLSIWEAQLASLPSFVLFESDSKVLHLEADTAFKKFVDACHEQGVPTVFWHTDAKEHCSMYRDIAHLMGYVGAVEQESVAFYEKNTNAAVKLLEHAIQPAIHNAIKEEMTKPMYSNMHFYFDGWADLIEYRDEYIKYLQPLSSIGLHIFESKWEFMKNKLPETPQFIKNIHGALGYEERLNAIKQFGAAIIALPSMKSSSTIIIEALEAIASKCVVIFRAESNIPMLDGLIKICQSDSELLDVTKKILEYPAYRDEHAHKAWRHVQTQHTFKNRLNTIAEWLGLNEKIENLPSIASVTITKRPELLLTNARRNYLQQTIGNKEWVIVLNTFNVDLENIKKSLADVPNVRIYQVAGDKNIGFCLNMAIGKIQSDYWAKMDDDDFYGANYLMDYMLNIQSQDVDLIGKVPSFTYLEAEDCVYIRHPGNWDKTDVKLNAKKLHMCGATFCGKKASQYKVKFSETIRSAVDSTWYSDCVNAGLEIIISDCYEMTIYRASDKSKHTWRLEDEDLKLNSIFVSNGTGHSIIDL